MSEYVECEYAEWLRDSCASISYGGCVALGTTTPQVPLNVVGSSSYFITDAIASCSTDYFTNSSLMVGGTTTTESTFVVGNDGAVFNVPVTSKQGTNLVCSHTVPAPQIDVHYDISGWVVMLCMTVYSLCRWIKQVVERGAENIRLERQYHESRRQF